MWVWEIAGGGYFGDTSNGSLEAQIWSRHAGWSI